jgi:hypothetical protein
LEREHGLESKKMMEESESRKWTALQNARMDKDIQIQEV